MTVTPTATTTKKTATTPTRMATTAIPTTTTFSTCCFFVVDVSAMLCEWKFTRVSTRRIWNKLDKLSQLQLSANCDRIMLIKGFRCCWCCCCCCCCCCCSCCSKQTSWVSALWGLQRRKTKTQFCQKFDLSFFRRTERLFFFSSQKLDQAFAGWAERDSSKLRFAESFAVRGR